MEPARNALCVPRANYACNIALLPLYLRNLIHERGRGFEQTPIYVGEITFKDISPLAPLHAYFAFLFAGILRRIGCRIRPYELEPGKTDKVIQHSLQRFTKMFDEPGMNRLDTVTAIIAEFEDIPYDRTARKTKIALFGDIYVRDNAVFNQQIIHSIEEQGGEVITTPYSEYAMMIAEGYFSRWFKEKQYGRLIAFKLLKAAMNYMEKAYHREFERILTEPSPDFHDDPSAILEEFDLRLDQAGETADNLLKTWYIRKHHPDIALFVQLNPGFCCAGTVTEALASRVEQVTGIPVLSLTYDGIGGRKNDAVIPYVRAAVERQQRAVMKS